MLSIVGFDRDCARVKVLDFRFPWFLSWLWIFFSLTLIGRGGDFQIAPHQWSLELLKQAKPGDRFILKPGIYKMNWKIKDLSGTLGMPIAITSEDLGKPATFEPTGGSLFIENGGYLVLDGLHIEGQLVASDLVSLSMRRCKIRRNSGWRWFENVIQLNQIRKVELVDSTFESLGMQTSILEAIDCDEILFKRCLLDGKFQQGIFIHNEPGHKKDAVSVAGLNQTIIRGGDFALVRTPTVQWNVKQSSLLHQKKDLFRWADNSEAEGDDSPKVVFQKNIVIHRLYELIDIVKSTSSPRVIFETEDSSENIWYCLDRPRLNPAHLSIQNLPGTQHGVIASPAILEGRAFMDDIEAHRIAKAFDVFEKKEAGFFWGYMFILFALTVFGMLSAITGVRREELTVKWLFWDTFFQSNWWSRIAVLLLALSSFLMYSAARFAPFELSGTEVLTLEHWVNRWSVADRANTTGQNLLLLMLGFGFTIFVSTGLGRGIQLRIVAASLCVSAITLVDIMDFFVFGGFSPPSIERIAFISLGAVIAIILLSFLSGSDQHQDTIRRQHLVEMKWVDIASLIGIFLTLLYSWYPLELQVNPRAMLAKLEGENVAIFPLQKNLRLFDSWIFVWHGILVGIALGRFLRFSRHRIRLAVGWSGIFWLTVEGMKLVFPNKILSMDHVFLSLAGSWFGLLIINYLDKTPDLLDFPSVLSFRAVVRWAMGFSWIVLPLWIDFGWYYLWYLTK